jgi:serine/threonine protein kinase
MESSHALPPGTQVDNYEIRSVLGVGGFGVTYKAWDTTLEREVALKEYFPSVLAHRAPGGTRIEPMSEHEAYDYDYGLNRFLDEGRTLAKFNEPSIVRVHRFLKANNTAYLVMDFEAGRALASIIKEKGAISQRSAQLVLGPILKGLAVVHAKNYLHRDIKPANIYIRSDGSPVLLDFGSAREAFGRQTMTVLLTPGYAPAEQYSSGAQQQGPWSDLYAVGATMFQCISGAKPPPANLRERRIKDGEEDPVAEALRVLELGGGYHRDFLDIVAWLLAPLPDGRPGSAAQVLEKVQRLAPPPAKKPKPAPVSDLSATQHIQWDPQFLSAVNDALRQQTGREAAALVQEAAQATEHTEELARLLAANIKDAQVRDRFVNQTRAEAHTIREVQHRPVVRVQTAQLPRHEALKQTQLLLASLIGPEAKVLVRTAALKAGANRTAFYDAVLSGLEDAVVRQHFIAGVRQFDPESGL